MWLRESSLRAFTWCASRFLAPTGRLFRHFHPFVGHHDLSQREPVRLQKRLLNDGYAARRSICAFSAVEGMWAVRAYRVVLRRFDECDSQRRLFDPTEPLLLRGGGLQTTRPNFRVAVLLKYRSNAHDVVEGTYADDPGPIGSLRKLLGGR